ncbi:TPA: ABC-F family ATP-binding cassette domain-containing protein [Clostridioides difficile]|nr:ABC-F family ATP-binding cassette domain-containing protein [Clostridioides difficile]
MSLLKVTNLSQCFMDKSLYEKANFDLFKGEHIGVVGQNGTGKSTLIKILLGEVVPDSGEIKWQPNINIGHLDQYAEINRDTTISLYLHTAFEELYKIEKEMNLLYQKSAISENGQYLIKASDYQEQLIANNFYSIDNEINKIANGLGLDSIGMNRVVGELSGGQRAKVILAKLLLSNHDVLLLDEPTNFLDKEHVEWLSNYLNTFNGAFIVVSHDFDFLEKISTGILDIEFGMIKKYHGKYSEFLKQKSHLREDYIRRYQAQQKKIEKEETFIRKNKAGVNSKIARGRQKQLDKIEKIAPPSFTGKPNIQFSEIEISAQNALTITNLEVGYYYSLLPKLNFSVDGGQKIVITGFNGIGKSTLLKTLVKDIPRISGDFQFSEQVKIGYYEQDLKWENPDKTPLQIVADKYPKLNTKEIRRHLARCGVKEEHVSRSVSTLSGGEQSKVKLCCMMLSPCNFLILDEPTNHFDAETKDALQNALKQFRGSIILVSHEEKFYKGWIDKVFNIEKQLV